MTTALQVADGGGFAIVESGDSAEILSQILDMGVANYELPQVRVPAGGATTWEVELADGTESSKELDIIIGWYKSGIRKFYMLSPEESEGGASAPDCQSEGGGVAFGSISPDATSGEVRECEGCPMNQFGTSKSGSKKGKACGEYGELYAFVPGELMPICVQIPAKSLKPMKQYAIKQLSKRRPLTGIVTTLTLHKETQPRPHAVMDFAFKRELTAEEAAQVASLGDVLKARFRARSGEELASRAASLGGEPREVEEVDADWASGD